MSLQLSIIIVGAGIGGLAAAVALRKAGHRTIVLEKHSSKHEVGYAVTISPNAARVLYSFEFDFAKARVVRSTEDAIIQALPGQYPFKATLGKTFEGHERDFGFPSMTVHRMDLWSELNRLAIDRDSPGVPAEIREGVAVTKFDPSGSVTLQDGTVLKADVVVAADGVKSEAYKAILVDGVERPAKFTGISNVRFCVPTAQLKEDRELAEYIEIAATGHSATVGAEQGRYILRYPCRDGQLQNFGLYSVAGSDSGENQILSARIDKQAALERLQGYHSALHRLLDHCTEDDLYLWNCLERDSLPSYHNGRLIVLGDAAHPMLPTLGSGAVTAIEDGGVLGLVLKSIMTDAELNERLGTWNSLRRPRANAAQLFSRCLDVNYELSSEVKAEIRTYLSEEELPEFTRPCVQRMMWSYDCLNTTEKALRERKDSLTA